MGFVGLREFGVLGEGGYLGHHFGDRSMIIFLFKILLSLSTKVCDSIVSDTFDKKDGLDYRFSHFYCSQRTI